MTNEIEPGNQKKTARKKKIGGVQQKSETKRGKPVVAPKKGTRKPKSTDSSPVKRHRKKSADKVTEELLEKLAADERNARANEEDLVEVLLGGPQERTQGGAKQGAKAQDENTAQEKEQEPVDPFAGHSGCNFVLNPKEDSPIVAIFKIVLKLLKDLGVGGWWVLKQVGAFLDRSVAAEAKLNSHSTVWKAAAPADVIFERLLTQFKLSAPGFSSHRWNQITPSPATLQIFFQADWRERDPSPNSNWVFETGVKLQLDVFPVGRESEVRCNYFHQSNNLMNLDVNATSLIRNTNYVIRELCARPE